MKILFKLPKEITLSRRLHLDLDLSYNISDIRKRISKIIDVPLSFFHLTTKICGVHVLITDSWPLSFFVCDEGAIFKIKLLESQANNRRETIVNMSPVISSILMINHATFSNPLQVVIANCKVGNLGKIKEAVERYEKESKEEDLLNQVEENLWGPLHYACLAGHSDLVEYLVSMKVNCNKVTIDEWTPLQLSCYFGREESVKELLKHPNLQINKKTKLRGTGLHLACETGHPDIVRLLLNKNAHANLEDHRHKKPIELSKSSKIQSMLLEYTLESESKADDKEFTPFCSEVYVANSFSLNDKQVFLYLDTNCGLINHFTNKEQFLDKIKPEYSIRIVDIQDVRFDYSRKNQYIFALETSKGQKRYYTKYEALTDEWLVRIRKAVEFAMISRQHVVIEQINELNEDRAEDGMNDSTNSTIIANEQVDISSFTIMEEIGSGSFGTVYKVRKINTGSVYAMKSLSKSALQKQKQLKYAISECKIMRQLNHPFIVPLYYAFQTPKYLYLILELCPNGDLFDLLEKKGVLDEQLARFYMAEVILALEYLHESEIIYRDLKPANVLLDSEYHVKLADFGLAKEKVDLCNPAMTMAGSPAYLPPEIVLKKGATYQSDIYGLGPLLYELLTGTTPYYAEDIELLFHNIKAAKLSFPETVSASARELITLVMNKDPSKRPQISQIKRLAFFKKMNWEALLARRIRPPCVEFNI